MRPNDRKFGEKQSFPFPLWNGLLEHRKRLGSAIWEFLWCLDKITAEKDGVGLVWDGAPVKAKQIAQEFKVDRESVKRNLRKLSDKGYLRLRRTPHGYSISVMNSLKFGIWAAHKRSDRNVVSLPERDDKKVASESGEATEVSLHEDTKVSLVESTQQSYAATDSLSERDEQFKRFWEIYPKRRAKKTAERAWKKIKLSQAPTILAAVERWTKTEEWKREGGRFIPYPATFLNGERWEDIAEESQRQEARQGQEREMVRARIPA